MIQLFSRLLKIIMYKTAVLVTVLFAFTATAFAEGETRYSSSNLQFHDGSGYKSTHNVSVGSGCSSAGQTRYSSSRIEFCNGSTWRSTDTGLTNGACSASGQVRYNTSNNILEFCNGSTWRLMYDPYSYSWITGSYGSCSVSCGGGTQTRSVVCRRSNGVNVSDSYCGGGKPGTSQSCNTQPCYTYAWKTGSYGSCSVSCGGGTQTRSVWCERSDGATVSDGNCGGGKPSTSKTCNTNACYSYSWKAGSFGSCSATCGGGTQTRTVWCERSDGTTVSDGNCGGGKPSTSQSCNTQACASKTWQCIGFEMCWDIFGRNCSAADDSCPGTGNPHGTSCSGISCNYVMSSSSFQPCVCQ